MDPLALPFSMALLSSVVMRVVMVQRGESPWAEVGISAVSETGGKKKKLPRTAASLLKILSGRITA